MQKYMSGTVGLQYMSRQKGVAITSKDSFGSVLLRDIVRCVFISVLIVRKVGLLGGTAFSLAYFFVTIPAAVLIEYLPSRKKFLFFAILAWSLFSAASCVRRFAFMFLCRMGVGLGEAVLAPTAYGLLSDLYPPDKRGRALGTYIMGSFVGVGLSFFISSVVLQTTTLAPWKLTSWQFCFVILGIVGFASSFLLLTIKEPRKTTLNCTPDFTVVISAMKRKKSFFAPFYFAVFLFCVCMSSWAVWVMFFFQSIIDVPPVSDLFFFFFFLTKKTRVQVH
jgi:MFS family permease